jgi:hypothetical protein
MALTKERYDTISEYYPFRRGNVRLSNPEILNAIQYVPDTGCNWRGHCLRSLVTGIHLFGAQSVGRLRIGGVAYVFTHVAVDVARFFFEAMQVGFSDRSHFSQQFRAVTGHSPSNWRRKTLKTKQ